jgi:hypothetical protein
VRGCGAAALVNLVETFHDASLLIYGRRDQRRCIELFLRDVGEPDATLSLLYVVAHVVV